MTDLGLFLDYRLLIVRVGLALSWLGTAGFIWLANRGPGPAPDDAVAEAIVLVGMISLLTLAPWRTVLAGVVGDLYIGIWTVVVVGGLVAAQDFSAGPPLSVTFIVVVVFAAATLVRSPSLGAIAVVALGGYFLALDRSGVDLGEAGSRIGLLTFAVAAMFAVVASIGVTRIIAAANRRLVHLEALRKDLEERREELDELYSVSATIGLGGTLSEIVPVVMGRIIQSVGARVGLVFLFRPDHDDLELISPLWVAGRAVRAEGYTLPLTAGGLVQQVFTSGDPLVSNHPSGHVEGEPLLADLDTSRVAAVSMAVDGRPIGVLVLADKTGGDFSDSDVARLQSLAGPAALVMNQMAKYDAAQEMSHKMTELAQLKSDFVSVVSHELRSPITSIIGSLRTFMRPEIEPDSETASDLIATAARQADRLRSLIEDLLVTSRLDSDALPVRPEATRIDGVIAEVMTDLPAAVDRTSTHLAADLPEIQVDPGHLRRILHNLVENAMKYSDDSDIEIVAKISGDQLWISVIDHGPGIPYELHDHIFQPFTQAQHHQTRMQGGTGLGLSIVRGLTESMGGRVLVRTHGGRRSNVHGRSTKTNRSQKATSEVGSRSDVTGGRPSQNLTATLGQGPQLWRRADRRLFDQKG